MFTLEEQKRMAEQHRSLTLIIREAYRNAGQVESVIEVSDAALAATQIMAAHITGQGSWEVTKNLANIADTLAGVCKKNALQLKTLAVMKLNHD